MPLDGFMVRSSRYPFNEILPNECAWPLGEVGAPDFHFCGGKVVEGSAYCHIHKAKAYIPREQYRAALALLKREAGLELRRIAKAEEQRVTK